MTITDEILIVKINGLRILKNEEDDLIELFDLGGNKIGLGWILEIEKFNDEKFINECIMTSQSKYLDPDFSVFFISKNEIKFQKLFTNILIIEKPTLESFLMSINKIISTRNNSYFETYRRNKEQEESYKSQIKESKKKLQDKEHKIKALEKEISKIKEEISILETNNIKEESEKLEKIIKEIILDRLTSSQREKIKKSFGHYKQISIDYNDSKIILKYYLEREIPASHQSGNHNDDGVPEWAWGKEYGPNPLAQVRDYTYTEIDQDGRETILYNGEKNESSLNEEQKEFLFNLNYYAFNL
jgi:hypothetical protein